MGFTTRLELHSQATRLDESVPGGADASGTGLAPSLTPHSKGLPLAPVPGSAPLDYNSACADLQVELIPVHSPLLGESWLVSFPPLSYMLKFSGSSCLISGQNGRGVWGSRAVLPALERAAPGRHALRLSRSGALRGGIDMPCGSYHTMLGPGARSGERDALLRARARTPRAGA